MEVSVVGKLKNNSRIVIGVLVTSIIVSFLIVKSSVENQSVDAQVINISGRQRMLSQNVVKLALLLRNTTDDAQFKLIQDDLSSSQALWQASHRGLKQGSTELNIPNDFHSVKIDSLFSELENPFTLMNIAINQIKSLNYTQKEMLESSIAGLLENEGSFLVLMDEITFQYAKEASYSGQKFSLVWVLISLFQLGIVLALAPIFFWPTIAWLTTFLNKINSQNAELVTAQDFLKRTNNFAKLGGWSFTVESNEFDLTDSIDNVLDLPDEFTPSNSNRFDFIKEPARTRLLHDFSEAINKKTAFDLELHIETFKGTKKWVRIIGNPVIEANRCIGFNGIIQDIDEQIAVRKDLENSKLEAQEAYKAKTEFLAVMSHEIRTPLNSVLGFSELLSKEITDTAHSAYLNTINKSGKSLLSLINGILDLSKIEAGKVRLRPLPTDLHYLMEEIHYMFSVKLDEKMLSFSSNYDGEIPRALMLDDDRLKQILVNLVGNAIKFTEQGGISIHTHRIDDSSEKDRVDIRIDVVDSGIGIDPSHVKKVFRSFEQVDSSSRRKYEGSGLGLAIAQKLATLMNGELTVDSTNGVGSTFSLFLYNIEVAPVPEKSSSRVSMKEDLLTYNQQTILVVDDHKINRVVVKSMLQKLNFNVIEASDGEEGMEFAKKYSPQMIFMDIRMPKIDGYEATKMLKQNIETSHIPIIALTASVTQDEQKMISENKFDGFLAKPISFKGLLDQLIKFIEPQSVSHDSSTEGLPDSETYNPKVQTMALGEAILSRLQFEYLERWHSVKSLMILDEIETFADDLGVFAQQNSIHHISNWVEEINQSLVEFDIPTLEKTFGQFPLLVKS